jgi:hypothetical protein
MLHPMKTLGDDDNGQRDREKRQARYVAKAHVSGEEVAHVGAKDAGETERRPVARAQRRQMNLLHGSSFCFDLDAGRLRLGMRTGALGQPSHAAEDDGGQDGRCIEPAEGEPAAVQRLVEQIP